jgi:hypothetical protein
LLKALCVYAQAFEISFLRHRMIPRTPRRTTLDVTCFAIFGGNDGTVFLSATILDESFKFKKIQSFTQLILRDGVRLASACHTPMAKAVDRLHECIMIYGLAFRGTPLSHWWPEDLYRVSIR